ncbi:PsiF family protein [Yersinia ruckeri]|uniref:PsiF family protein n=1 Tax=Yersinia ruckeri TaxID=29486 RepID=UPI002238B02E|nr:PsiF family protein [Yersinia ruckeri]MCW6568854.1 PsiF family protein [Yersinia ruckeri]
MRLTTLWLLSAGLLLSANLMAADVAKTPSPAQLAQQKKMTDCNHAATSKTLKGDERKKFMSNCLKTDAPAAMTPQQNKMKFCNAEAKDLKGDARKTFMSSCLKKTT